MQHSFTRFRSLLVAAAIVATGALALACDSPTEASGPAGIKPNFLQSCAGIPNGAVSQVVTTPTATIKLVNTPHKDTVYAQVFRDDPNFPGVQNYCQDYAVAVTWSGYGTNYDPVLGWYHYFDAENIHAQDITVYATSISGRKPLIATVGGKVDTTWVTSGY